MEQAGIEAIVVPHTHWDRAWYLPFETFRHRLVRLIDRLIDLLDRDPAFRSFTLDGQTVLLDDYLEICPDRRGDIERLVRAGRLIVGPWYTAPDLFLPSGESLIRNLQTGIQRSRQLGAQTGFTGYAPDPFGHPSQMPQIMSGMGIDSYLFMRGMWDDWNPSGSIFEWEAPDGARVLAFYLREGYFAAGGLGLPFVYGRFDGLAPDPERAAKQLDKVARRLASLQEERTVLLLNGFDHMPEQSELPRLLDHANARLSGVAVRHGTIREYVGEIREQGRRRTTYSGDLLGQTNHPILASVWSTRMYLKRQNNEAERWLVEYAEPLIAGIGASHDSAPLLQHAWRELLKNHAHDDICGCSVDPVHDDDERRFAHVQQLAQSLIAEQLESLVKSGGDVHADERTALLFVHNPLPFPVIQHIEADVHFPIAGGESGLPLLDAVPIIQTPDGGEVVPRVVSYEPRTMRTAYLEQTWASRYRIRFDATLPPTGYHIYRVRLDDGTRKDLPVPPVHEPIVRDGARLLVDNGDVRFEDQLRSVRIDSLFRFEYDRDAGDTYSYSPVKGDIPRTSRLTSATRPAADTLRLRHEIDVPEALDSDARITLVVDVDVRLGAGGAVSISGRYVNSARDGRLRIVVRTGIDTDIAHADGQFIINDHRMPSQELPEEVPEKYAAYPGELPYSTRHQQDFAFVSDGEKSVWLANKGLPEYELVREGGQSSIAITLHRAVGHLSVVGGRIRRCGAGPHIAVPGAQCQREMSFEIALGTASTDAASVTRAALPHAHPPLVSEMPYLPYAGGVTPEGLSASFIEIDDPALRLSALRRSDDGSGYVIRLHNPTGADRRSRLQFRLPAGRMSEATLLETWEEPRAVDVRDGRATLTLRAGEIKTLLLRP